MSAKLALLCPGQGAQHRDMFALTAAVVQLPPDDAQLFENRYAQPLIVDATLAMWQAIRSFVPQPALVAGYSVGELSAYGVAGALTNADAHHIAGERARLMDACRTPKAPQVMLAVAAISIGGLKPCLLRHGFHLAIENGDANFVVGGLERERDALVADLLALGAAVTPLAVQIASHTPLMVGAVAGFAEVLTQNPLGPMTMPVLAGINAAKMITPEAATATLLRQLTEPVRWAACMDALAESGITVALELGPGATLSRMLQQRHPQIACRSVADFRSLRGIEVWLERQCSD